MKYIYKPLILNPSNSKEKEVIGQLKSDGTCQIIDTINSQLRELFEIESPSESFSDEEFLEKKVDLLDGRKEEDYGLWIYYEWLNIIVHVLNEADFIAVRSNRNRGKVSKEEQLALSSKMVGVVGMSVGSSIARTMILERSCGHIRLADFDDLELSNLNRIQASVLDIGIPKVIICARQIAEIDPFINVEIYSEGVTESNIDAFMDSLDLVFDECDSIGIKFSLRNHAKKFQIPLIMDTSDNGMIDVERFDLDAKLPIFHGSIDKYIENPTGMEKMQMIYAILGEYNMSNEIKAAFSEINKTIKSWPQLGSSVTSGAGHATAMGRKVLLGDKEIGGKYLTSLENVAKV